jgi:ubiquinone/menaquinone biosynthesis C-methylase UbiE
MGTAEMQGQIWGARAKDWAEVGEGTSNDLFEAILRKSGVGKNTILLDIGCGAGMFCKMAASRGAKVSGIDASEPLVQIARTRVRHGDFRSGDMENLPYPDRMFNLVTGINSFQFAESIPGALREARRVAQNGAQVVMAVWGKPEDCEATAAMRAVGSFLPPPPVSRDRKPLYSRGTIEAIAEEAGLNPGTAEEVACSWEFPDEQSSMRAILSAGLSTIAIERAGEQVVREAILKAIGPFKTLGGGYRFRNTFLVLISRA